MVETAAIQDGFAWLDCIMQLPQTVVSMLKGFGQSSSRGVRRTYALESAFIGVKNTQVIIPPMCSHRVHVLKPYQESNISL